MKKKQIQVGADPALKKKLLTSEEVAHAMVRAAGLLHIHHHLVFKKCTGSAKRPCGCVNATFQPGAGQPCLMGPAQFCHQSALARHNLQMAKKLIVKPVVTGPQSQATK